MGPGSGRIDDDVQLGYWLSKLPQVPRGRVRVRRRGRVRVRAWVRVTFLTPSLFLSLAPTLSLTTQLHYVTFRRYMAWHDRWKGGVTDMLPRLLLAHKVILTLTLPLTLTLTLTLHLTPYSRTR